MLEFKLFLQSTLVLLLSIVNMMTLAPDFTRRTVKHTLATADIVIKTVSGSFRPALTIDATPTVATTVNVTPATTMVSNASRSLYDDYTSGGLFGVENWSPLASLQPFDLFSGYMGDARRLFCSTVSQLEVLVCGIDPQTRCIMVFMLALTLAVIIVKVARKVATRKECPKRPGSVEHGLDTLITRSLQFDPDVASFPASDSQAEFNAFVSMSDLEPLAWVTADGASTSLDPFLFGGDIQTNETVDEITPATILSPSLTSLFTFTAGLNISSSAGSSSSPVPSSSGLLSSASSPTGHHTSGVGSFSLFTPAEITATSSIVANARLGDVDAGLDDISQWRQDNSVDHAIPTSSVEATTDGVDPANVPLPPTPDLSIASSSAFLVLAAGDNEQENATRDCTPHDPSIEDAVDAAMPPDAVREHPVTDALEPAPALAADILDTELTPDASCTRDPTSPGTDGECNANGTTTEVLPPIVQAADDDDDDEVFVYPGASPEASVLSLSVPSIAIVSPSDKAGSSSNSFSILDVDEHPEISEARGLHTSIWANADPTPIDVISSPTSAGSSPIRDKYFSATRGKWPNRGLLSSVPPMPGRVWDRGPNRKENGATSPVGSDFGRRPVFSNRWDEDSSPSPSPSPSPSKAHRAPLSLQKTDTNTDMVPGPSLPASTKSSIGPGSYGDAQSSGRISPSVDDDSAWPSNSGVAESMWAPKDHAPLNVPEPNNLNVRQGGANARKHRGRGGYRGRGSRRQQGRVTEVIPGAAAPGKGKGSESSTARRFRVEQVTASGRRVTDVGLRLFKVF